MTVSSMVRRMARRDAKPFSFEVLTHMKQTHEPENRITPLIVEQLSIRFAQNFQRLSLVPYQSQDLGILRSLHAQSVTKCLELQDFFGNSDAADESNQSRFKINIDYLIVDIVRDLEGRHSSSSYITMEIVRQNMQHLSESFLTTRISCLMLLQLLAGISNISYGKVALKTIADEAVVTALAIGATALPHGEIPEVFVEDSTPPESSMYTFTPFVHYILVEVLKNAIRAVMEKKIGPGIAMYESKAAIRVVISAGYVADSIHISVEDYGIGMTRDEVKTALHRFENSSNNVNDPLPRLWDRLDDQVSYQPKRSPMCGIGVGLGLSRLYSSYLGGSLNISSRPGIGTIVTLQLPRDGTEVIPRRL